MIYGKSLPAENYGNWVIPVSSIDKNVLKSCPVIKESGTLVADFPQAI